MELLVVTLSVSHVGFQVLNVVIRVLSALTNIPLRNRVLFSMGGSRGGVQTSLENYTLLDTGTREVIDPRSLRPAVTKIFSRPH